jgi:two-component system NtrC family sensor kinase
MAELLNVQLQAEIIGRKKAEEALINSEKLASVGRMAAVLSHEINNPLEAVTNVLFLAQTTENLPEVARQYLQLADAELNIAGLCSGPAPGENSLQASHCS